MRGLSGKKTADGSRGDLAFRHADAANTGSIAAINASTAFLVMGTATSPKMCHSGTTKAPFSETQRVRNNFFPPPCEELQESA